MILLLGKNALVETYVRDVLERDVKNELFFCVGGMVHYTEFPDVIKAIHERNNQCDKKPLLITTQNKEFITMLLNSDLDFEVITVYDGLKIRQLNKDKAVQLQKYGLELR